MSEVARGWDVHTGQNTAFRRGLARIRRPRPAAGILVGLAVVVGLLAGPATASSAKTVTGAAATSSHSTPSHSTPRHSVPSHAAHWKWSAPFSLGKHSHLKKNQPYGTYGLVCPTTHLCIEPMAGTRITAPLYSPAGDFITTTPARGASGWRLSKWDEDYAPGDSLSPDNVACAPAGNRTDCIIAGREPAPGGVNNSYGATVFQTGTPTVANWGAALVDDNSPGFGAVSCFVNVQCAEIDDQGTIYTTAGASVTSAVSVFPADADVSGIWAIGCAQHTAGESTFFCAAVDQNGRGTIAWTLNPGQADTKWKVVNTKHGDDFFNVACFRPGECLINNGGELLVSHGATTSASWTKTFKKVTLPKGVGRSVATLSCNDKLCAVAGDAANIGQYVAISTNPDHGPWSVIAVGKTKKAVLRDGISNVSCPTTTLCVLTNGYGQVTTGTR
jgi:hypothetical protein